VHVTEQIQKSFPGMEVVGSHHPPTATNAALAKAVGFAQFSAIAATFRCVLYTGPHTTALAW
jgi:hypothetical protein